MPRGVTGSGPYAGRKRPPKAKARPKVQPAVAAAAPATLAPASVPAPAFEGDDSGPLGSVHVESLSGDVLKRYARRAGVPIRDIENLTEDRLRQNVILTIANHFNLITEG